MRDSVSSAELSGVGFGGLGLQSFGLVKGFKVWGLDWALGYMGIVGGLSTIEDFT